MEQNAVHDLGSINATMLTPIVCQSLRRDNFILNDWSVRQIGGGVGNPVSVGLYRCAGTGQDQAGSSAWSVILKIIQSPANVGSENMGEGDDQSHWNYWKREPLIYQSGLLETLPAGMVAPRCFGVVERPGNVTWLWLEDIIDADAGIWTLDRYALTARHLGQLNGIYLAELPMPSFPWLSRHRTQSWLALMPWQTFPWDQPQVLERYPRAEVNPFRRLLVENDRFLVKLELLPETFCHGDTYPTNFMSRTLPSGQQQIVALDWALAGVAPLGDDLGQFVFGAQANLKNANKVDIDIALFENYLDGLRDSGCRVDPWRVRFSYTASAALRVGLFQLYLMSEQLNLTEPDRVQVDQKPVAPDCFEVVMAAEAIELLEAMG